ncbi:MAG: F0F1 ATP synthase subunit delta [Alphaproteobacteria bacterium]
MAAVSSEASGLAGRYAGALFDLAKEQEVLDQVQEDLAGVKGLLAESADFTRLIESPAISKDDQVKALTAVAEKAGLADLTKKFLGLLAAKRRAFALPGVIDAYDALLADEKGLVQAEVISAVELTEAQAEDVQKNISKSVGKTVTMTRRVDPSLLGGLVVRVGSRMIDASLKTKLHQLELAMKGAA